MLVASVVMVSETDTET